MKVYNKEKTQILYEYDLSNGYLLDDKLQIGETPEQPFIADKGHYETLTEYENGGKDVKWVVDKKGQEYRPSEPIYEDIKVFIPYTQKELIQKTIDDLKWWFDNFYEEHEQKYRRLHTMHKLCDDGSDPYNKLMELYELAEINRKEIQRYEQMV